MIIWGAVAIPVLVAIVLLRTYKHHIVVWEYLLLFGIPLAFIGLAKWGVEKVQTSDTEYWGGYVKVAEYYERWDEEVPCTHTKYCDKEVTVPDGKGGTTTKTERVDCGKEHNYDVEDHPPVWQIKDSNGQTVTVSKGKYQELVDRFGNARRVELNRDYHSKDGDKYVAEWDEKADNSDETLEAVFTKHTYENRVQASSSIFNFQDVSDLDRASYHLFEYPAISGFYGQKSILGNGDSTQVKAEEILRIANAKLGRAKQVRIFVLVFRNQPLEAGMLQEQFWKRGNKNELVITLGVDDSGKVQWSHVFSWTEVEELKIELRDYAANMGPLNLVAIVNTAIPLVEEKWKRKQFAEFRYLTVEPAGWAVGLVFLGTLLVNLGIAAWAVHNKHRERTSGYA